MSELDKKSAIMDAGKSINMLPADIWSIQCNLNLFDAFVERAFYVVSKGRTRFAARTIVEVLRWNTTIEDTSKTFKISNNITPKMSQLSMELFPALNGLFSLRD